MKVLITGANGFIGRNLAAHLQERKDVEVIKFSHEDDFVTLDAFVKKVDFIFHLAGVNRPQNVEEFKTGNTDLTKALCASVVGIRSRLPARCLSR